MNILPDPLHPAVVHFPIAFMLLGTVLAIFSFLCFKSYLRFFALILFVLSALGATLAVKTGSEAWDPLVTEYPSVDLTLNAHAESGEFTKALTIITAAVCLLAFIFIKFERIFIYLFFLTTLCALYTSFHVYKTARLGGDMVYKEALKISKYPPEALPKPTKPLLETAAE